MRVPLRPPSLVIQAGWQSPRKKQSIHDTLPKTRASKTKRKRKGLLRSGRSPTKNPIKRKPNVNDAVKIEPQIKSHEHVKVNDIDLGSQTLTHNSDHETYGVMDDIPTTPQRPASPLLPHPTDIRKESREYISVWDDDEITHTPNVPP